MAVNSPHDPQLIKSSDEKLETASDGSSHRVGPVDPERELEERRLVRKLDNRILPIACLLYLFACELCRPCLVVMFPVAHFP